VAPPNLLVDSHCHIDFPDFSEDLGAVLKRAAENGVAYLLCVSVEFAKFHQIKALTRAYSHVFSSVGTHPNFECLPSSEPQVCDLAEGSRDPGVIAVGETGLDYFRSGGELSWQRDRFRVHIRAAKIAKLPLIVHSRNAKDDTIEILRSEAAGECGGVMHCFTEDWPMAAAALDLGFYISFSGIVTFRNALDLQTVARKVPADRLLVETDAPYLSPVPMRGKRNEPAFVRHTAEHLAQLRGEPIEMLAEQTTGNFFRLFNKAKRVDMLEKWGVET
jgi:TatD DNase family protein